MTINKYFLYTFLFIIVLFTWSCKEDDEPDPVADEKLLVNDGSAWRIGTAGSVLLDGSDITSDWVDFTITIQSDGTYVTTGSADAEVWPFAGSWIFQDGKFLRGDGAAIGYVVTGSSLKFTFTYSNPGGRVEGTEGAYIFTFEE